MDVSSTLPKTPTDDVLAATEGRISALLNNALQLLCADSLCLAQGEQVLSTAAHANPSPEKTAWQIAATVNSERILNVTLYADFSDEPRLKKPRQVQLNALAQQVAQLWDLNFTAQHLDLLARHSVYYTALWQGSTEALIHFTEHGHILHSNTEAQTLLGYDQAQLRALNISDILPPSWYAERQIFIAQSPNAERKAPLLGWSSRARVTHSDGSKPFAELHIRQLVWPKQSCEEYFVVIKVAPVGHQHDRAISERRLLQTIIDASPNPIYARDRNGNYLIANQASQSVISPVVAAATRGGPYQSNFRQAVEQSERAHRKVLDTGLTEELEMQTPQGERFTVSKSPIMGLNGSVDGVVSVAHNVTAFWQASTLLEKQRHLLSVLHKGLTDYGAMLSGNQLWLFLQNALRELTASDYALIGEVQAEHNPPQLKVHAISDLSWNEQSRALMIQLRSGQMLINSPDSLLGKAYVHGQVVICNDVQIEGRAKLPLGHPQLNNYLAVPITDGEVILGMYAIANRQEPYDQELVAWLEPFTSTCSLLIKLHRQINEQQLTNAALKQAHQETERASQAKTEFLSNMSHELRTPLNSILGFAQLLIGHSHSDQRTRRQAEHILQSGKHLLELINEILDLARIESGHLALSLESIHLADVLQGTLQSLQGMAEQYSVHLDIDPEMAKGIWVRADFTRLRQVLDNLLSNAIKYNRPNGQARIEFSTDQQMLRVAVIDTGSGIARDKHALIFTPFNRLGAEAGAIEGTGVGLALTKKIIEHMQGSIGFTSEPNKGSTFWFELPVGEPLVSKTNTPAAWKPEELSMSHEMFRVLYVEDNPANLHLMQDIFEELDGFALLCARDGLSGLSQAQAHNPQLILLDINLPGLSGYQTLTLLRADPATADIPVIGLSANAMSRDIQAAQDAGFDTYLTKPLDLGELFRHLERYKSLALSALDQRP